MSKPPIFSVASNKCGSYFNAVECIRKEESKKSFVGVEQTVYLPDNSNVPIDEKSRKAYTRNDARH